MLTKLVIIDNRVDDYQTVINALRTDVGFIILEYDIDTYKTLKDKIDALGLHQPIESVALLSHGDFSENYKMLENANPSIHHSVEELDPELESWSEFIEFFKYLSAPIVDLLGCAIYMDNNWRYVLNKLETDMCVDFRASIDNTGSLATGANWILESDNANIKDIYFNEDIEGWLEVLGSGIGNFSAVIDSSGRVYTCGTNSSGQLGLGSSYTSVNVFTLVSSISNENVIQISTGESHMACVTDSGKLYTWGSNVDGQLGIGSSGSTTNQYLPQYRSDLSNIKIISVTCGIRMTICLDSSGYVYSTGNSSFIARNISLTPSNRFGQITDLSNNIIVQISSGRLHTGFLTINGQVYTSGTQSSGVLGNGQGSGSLSSIYLTDISNAYKIVCGYNNTGYIKNNGLLYTFGYNGGYGIFPNSNANVTITNRLYYNILGVNTPSIYNSNITDIILGNQHTYVFKGNTVYITGANPNGHTGFGSNYTLDISRVPRELDISAINIYSKQPGTTNQINTLILDTNYNLNVVGYNWYSDLGTGNNTNISNRTIISPTTFNPPTNRVELLPDTFKKQYGFLIYQTVADNSTTINRVGIYPNNVSYTYEISSIKRDGIPINNFTDISINSSTGTITRIGSISYGNYAIEVKATSTTDTVTGTAFLNMTRNPPSNLTYNPSNLRINFGDISSSVTPSINLGEATSVTYSLDSNITGISINSTTGVITCNNTILNSGTYNLIVIATSSNNVGSVITNFTIIVDPLAPSAFSYTPTSMTFKYGDVSNSPIPSINTGGSPSMLYEISGGNIDSIITINQTTGVISVNNPTTAMTYNLVIKASNANGMTLTQFTIIIAPIAPSTFSYLPPSIVINYGDISSSVAPTINTGGAQSILYEISGGNIGSIITINSSTGIITVNNPTSVRNYTLIIKASNNIGTVTTPYNIDVLSIAPSVFSYTPASMTLKYGDSSNSVIPIINKGGETNILYEISGGNIGSIVTICGSTGIITVNNPTTVGTYSLLIKGSNTKGTTVTPYSINVSPNKPIGFRYDPSSVTINYGESASSLPKYDNSSGNVNFNYSFVSDKIYYPDGININNNGTIITTTDLCSNTYKLTVLSNSLGGDVSTNLIIKVNTSDISYSNIRASDIRYKESFNTTVITGNFYNPYNNKPVDVTYTLFHNIANQIGTFPITAFINGGDNYKIGGQITVNVNVIPLEPSGYSYLPLSYIKLKDGSQNAIINDTGDQIYYSIIGISKDSIEFINNNTFSISNTGRISWTDQLLDGIYYIFTDASNSQGRKQAIFTLTIIDEIIPITKYTYNLLPSSLNYGQGYTSGLPDISGTVDSFNLTVSSNISNPSQYISINTDGIIILSPNIPVGTYNITASVINNISSSQVQKTISVNSVKPYGFSYDPSFVILDYKQSYMSSVPQINFGGENSVVYAIRESITGIDISKTSGLINIGSNTPVGKYVLDVDVSNSKGITTIPYSVTIRPLSINSFNYNNVSITIDVSGNSNIPAINETGEDVIFTINNIRRNGLVYTTDRISVDTSGQIRWTDDISSGSYIINVDASNSLYKISSSMNLNVTSTISNLSYSNFKSDISYGFNGTFYATYSGYIKNFSISVTKQNSNNQYEPYNNNNIVIDATYGNIIFSEGIPVGTYKLTITASNKENSFIVNPTIRVRMTPPSNFKYDVSNMVIGFGDISSSILPTVNNGGDDMVYYITNDSRIIVDYLTGVITTTNNILSGVNIVTVDVSNSIGKTSTSYKITVTKKMPSGLRYDPSYVEIFQGETINMSPILLNSGGNTSINYMYSSNGYGANPNIIINNGIISTTPILPIGTYNLVITLMSEVGNITTNALIKVKKPSNNPVNAVINYNESVKEILYDASGISLRPTIILGDISGLYVSNYSISNISNLIVNKVFIDNSGVLEFDKYIPVGQYNITVKATFNDQRFITTIYTLRVKSRPIDLYLPHIYDLYGTVTRNESISVADITQNYFIEEDSDDKILSLSTLKPLLKMRDNININNIQIGDLPSINDSSVMRNQIKSLLIRPSFKVSNNANERLTLKEHYKRNVSTSILGSKDIQLPTIIRNELEKDISNFDIGDLFVGVNGLNDLVVRRFLLKQLQDNRPERFTSGASVVGQVIDFPIQEGDSIIIRIKTESNIVKDSTIFDRSSIRRLLQHLSKINNINNFTVDNANKVVRVQPKIWSIKLGL